MGGRNMEAYDDLKQTLFTDTAVGGEAAGYAMGLIMLGTGDSTIANEMLTYTRETQHEKIIRGLAIGLAFLYFGRQDQADEIAKELLAEKVSQFSVATTQLTPPSGSYSSVWRRLHARTRLRRDTQ
jgi:26S proteasome regulatory subunit N2